jgi:hypothetical protein
MAFTIVLRYFILTYYIMKLIEINFEMYNILMHYIELY